MVKREIKRCPFCNARQISSLNEKRFRCGTEETEIKDQYITGNECDKTVFRNAFLRCHDLLSALYKEMVLLKENPEYEINKILIEDVKKEINSE